MADQSGVGSWGLSENLHVQPGAKPDKWAKLREDLDLLDGYGMFIAGDGHPSFAVAPEALCKSVVAQARDLLAERDELAAKVEREAEWRGEALRERQNALDEKRWAKAKLTEAIEALRSVRDLIANDNTHLVTEVVAPILATYDGDAT